MAELIVCIARPAYAVGTVGPRLLANNSETEVAFGTIVQPYLLGGTNLHANTTHYSQFLTAAR